MKGRNDEQSSARQRLGHTHNWRQRKMTQMWLQLVVLQIRRATALTAVLTRMYRLIKVIMQILLRAGVVTRKRLSSMTASSMPPWPMNAVRCRWCQLWWRRLNGQFNYSCWSLGQTRRRYRSNTSSVCQYGQRNLYFVLTSVACSLTAELRVLSNRAPCRASATWETCNGNVWGSDDDNDNALSILNIIWLRPPAVRVGV